MDLMPARKRTGFLLKTYLNRICSVRYIPSWVPFNMIPSMAHYGRNLIWSMINRPFEHVKRDMASGTARPSFTCNCLENFETEVSDLSTTEQDHLVRWAAGAMYGGKFSSLH